MKKVQMDTLLEEKQQKKNDVYTSDTFLQEVKLLEQNGAAEDLRIANGLGRHHSIAVAQKALGANLEYRTISKNYAGKVYTIDQIKSLCIDFNLRFLNSTNFTGQLDVEVLAKVKEFQRDANNSAEEEDKQKMFVDLNEHNLKTKFFIMAPAKMFKLKDEKYVTKRTARDPVMFYQVDDTHYRLIHKWGNDFSVMRYLKGFEAKSWWHNCVANTLKMFPVLAVLFTFLLPSSFSVEHTVSFYGICMLTSFIGAVFSILYKQDEGTQIEGYYSPESWNSYKKITR